MSVEMNPEKIEKWEKVEMFLRVDRAAYCVLLTLMGKKVADGLELHPDFE